MRIEKKVWPEYFEAILSGNKKFELRLGNFECQIGDMLVLREWNPETKKYTGSKIEKRITYILDTKKLTLWSDYYIKKYGVVVMSLEKGSFCASN